MSKFTVIGTFPLVKLDVYQCKIKRLLRIGPVLRMGTTPHTARTIEHAPSHEVRRTPSLRGARGFGVLLDFQSPKGREGLL